ncbi:MAG: hypothetical protein GY850_05270, partial [bacterium]|nr:hypothetical protein [bacterium]
RVYRHRRFQTIGGTAQYFADRLWDTTWDLEWFYEIGSPLMQGVGGSYMDPSGSTRKDILGVAIKVGDRWRMPKWFRDIFQTQKKMEITLTYFYEHIFNHKRNLVVSDRFHRPGNSGTDSCSLFIREELFNTSWNFVFIGNYYFKLGKWMAVPCFTYVFPDNFLGGGFRADIGAKLYGGAKHGLKEPSQLSHFMDKVDSIILRLRYEF